MLQFSVVKVSFSVFVPNWQLLKLSFHIGVLGGMLVLLFRMLARVPLLRRPALLSIATITPKL